MGYLPILLEVRGRSCVVIGGGEVATRRVELLVRKGALVRVISPKVTGRINELAGAGELDVVKRAYRPGDLDGCYIAFAATDDEAAHRQVADEGRRKGVLLNVSDSPSLCSFIMPATVERGELMIAVSTGGGSPAFAARMRSELEEQFGEEYGMVVEILRRLRSTLAELPAEERRNKLVKLARSPLPYLLRQQRVEEVDRILTETLGEGYALGKLGIVVGG